MFKKVFVIVLTAIMIFAFAGCDLGALLAEPATSESQTEKAPPRFIAEFYDNKGIQWLSVEGSSFDIKPNKVKEYSYSSDGSLISSYSISSIMTIIVDNREIESCGSTVLFYDTGLEKVDFEANQIVEIEPESGLSAGITHPSDFNLRSQWYMSFAWYAKDINNLNKGKRMVVIQSQEGDPICAFQGNSVSWDVPKQLPKTTIIDIDGKELYIHRANFMIIDLDLLA